MRSIHLSLILAALTAAACIDSTGPEHHQPAKLEIVYGQGQTGTVGSRLETLVAVRVVDGRGRPVAGEPVTFVVTGGGSVSPATGLTNRHGVAQSWWTMGTAAGTQAVEARVAAGATVLSTTFTARGTPGAAARLARYPVPDDSGFVTGIGGVLEDSLAVQVLDAFGNGVPGVEVAWTAPDGSGTVASPTATDSLGVARTTWRLGSDTDQLAYASVAGLGELRFVAQAATRLDLVCIDDCGELEVGSRVRMGVGVQYGSAGGPPAAVTFEVAPGSGSVTPAVSMSGAGSSTTGNGIAWVEWTLGDAPGPQKLTARLGGLGVEFTTDALPRLVAVAEVPGTVLDATFDRVLWVDTAGGGRVVKMRTLATGADATVMSGVPDGGAALFDGGALFWFTGGDIFEYRNGTLASLGWFSLDSPPSVEGNWAAWGVRVEGPPIGSGPSFITRRDLAGGTSLILPDPAAPPGIISKAIGRKPDVGPHGEVVFLRDAGWLAQNFPWIQVLLYRGGSFGGFTRGGVQAAWTDGINVAYSVYDPGWFRAPPSTTLCIQNVTCMEGGGRFLLTEGWAVFSGAGQATAVRHSPAGVTDQIPNCSSLQALAPDGTLVCGYGWAGRRLRLVRPDGTGYDTGLGTGGRVVWRGDRFLVLRDGGVYTFGAPPAAVRQ